MRAVFSRHRDIARGAMARVPTGPNAIATMDRMLALLRTSGLPDQVVAYAADLLPLYLTAMAYEDSQYEARGLTQEQMADYIDELQRYFATLPAERFPNIVAMASALTTGAVEERFEFGLQVLIRGLIAMADDERFSRPDG